MKYWINEKDKSNKIIAITKEVFYLYNPNERTLKEFKDELILGKIPARLSGIQFSRIRKIDFEEGQNSLEIHYDAKEKRKINLLNTEMKSQIQETLEKEGPEYLERKITEKGFLEQSYGYLTGILAIGVLSFFSYFIAVEKERGYEYMSGGLWNIPIAIGTYTGKVGSILIGLAFIALIILRLYFVLKKKSSFDRFLYRK